MQRNSVISLRSSSWAWQRALGPGGAEAEAVYGCVDWYLYQDADASTVQHDPPASLIERAAAAASAAAARTPTPVEAFRTHRGAS